jgi:hypothetical protein
MLLFRSPRKRQSKPAPAESPPQAQQPEPLREWRRSAQRVTRAWNAWLAAEGRDRDARYGDYEAALAAEELAAARFARHGSR